MPSKQGKKDVMKKRSCSTHWPKRFIICRKMLNAAIWVQPTRQVETAAKALGLFQGTTIINLIRLLIFQLTKRSTRMLLLCVA